MTAPREPVRIEYAGTRVGRWLRGTVAVRRMLVVGLMCFVVPLNTWLPRAIQGLFVLAGFGLVTWNLVLTWRRP